MQEIINSYDFTKPILEFDFLTQFYTSEFMEAFFFTGVWVMIALAIFSYLIIVFCIYILLFVVLNTFKSFFK